jgi:hypothetical protein
MPTNITTNRSYQLPHPDNFLDEDALRIIAALEAIDVDVASLFTSMSGKAAAGHGHVIGDVSGLQAALDGKLSSSATFTLNSLTDVNAASPTSGMFLRYVSTEWVPVVFDGSMVATGTIAGARLGSHSHAISDVTGLQTALDGKQAAGSYAAASHTHTIANVTGLQTALDEKAALTAIVGKQTISIPAEAMTARATNGASYAKDELATNDVMAGYWAFDAATSEAVQARVRMPKGMNESVGVEVEFIWKHPATTVNFGVTWGARARAVGDNEALDGAWGTEQEVADTGGTTGNQYKTAFTSTITIGNTMAEGDVVYFEFYRDPADGSDTMAVDAHLLGVTITFTTNAAKDD